MANNTDIERLNYYEGEFLGAADFEAEQEYHRDMRRRHNVGQHTWGIVSGLDLVQIPNGATTPGGAPEVDIYVQPGMAVDGFGREIVALNKTQLTQDLFAPYFSSNSTAPQTMYIWVSYAQVMLQPPSEACTRMNQPNAFGRVQETFALTVTPDPKGPANDLIVVDGKAMTPLVQPGGTPPAPPQPGDVVLPYDDAVPYQEFSTDDSSVNWYILIGQVSWDPHNEVFVQQPDAFLGVGRQYAGNVTSAIFTPDNSLKIRDRFAPDNLPKDPTDPTLGQFYGGVSVKLAGSLSVDRFLEAAQNVLIDGVDDLAHPDRSPLTIKAAGTNEELIQFRNPTGVETWLVCENPGGSNTGLHIGEISAGGKAPGVTRLFIQSSLTGIAPSPVNVGIGTLTPRNPLAVLAQGAWEELLSFEDLNGKTNWHVNQSPQGQNFKRGLNFSETSIADFRLFLQAGGNVGLGTPLPQQNLSVNGGLNIDQAEQNNGSLNPGLSFGSNSGEGLASNRNPGTKNHWGLDFYTSSKPRLSITKDGNVGIGTQAPAAALDINGSLNVSGTVTSGLDLTINGNRTYLIGVDTANLHWIMAGGTAEPGDNALGFDIVKRQVRVHWNLVADGDISAGGSKAGYIVDRFINHNGRKLEQGDVVVLQEHSTSHFYGSHNQIPLVGVELTEQPHDTRVCGVVDEPTASAASTSDLDRSQLGAVSIGLMVTLGAYAYCKVDADIAPIAAGDLLTTSASPGYAQKVDLKASIRPGGIIGKALGSLKKGKGKISILVSHQ